VILPDGNILVHAFRSDSSEHERCRSWLDGVVNGDSRYGMAPQVLSGVIRVTTHPKVFVKPSGIGRSFARLCAEADARGNMVPDAWFAALAMESGCEWITLDRDYARFQGLRWRVPE
jgi:predicted nucleic acid-binding protein